MKVHLRNRGATLEGKPYAFTRRAIKEGRWTLCRQIIPESHMTDDIDEVTCVACQGWYKNTKQENAMFKYECTNAVGYEGRLTKGKQYNRATALPVAGDFVFIIFDDGTTGEALKERFEMIDTRIKPNTKMRTSSQVFEDLMLIKKAVSVRTAKREQGGIVSGGNHA
jgi:hypothetical protein